MDWGCGELVWNDTWGTTTVQGGEAAHYTLENIASQQNWWGEAESWGIETQVMTLPNRSCELQMARQADLDGAGMLRLRLPLFSMPQSTSP